LNYCVVSLAHRQPDFALQRYRDSLLHKDLIDRDVVLVHGRRGDLTDTYFPRNGGGNSEIRWVKETWRHGPCRLSEQGTICPHRPEPVSPSLEYILDMLDKRTWVYQIVIEDDPTKILRVLYSRGFFARCTLQHFQLVMQPS
jgi:hypothetical protein